MKKICVQCKKESKWRLERGRCKYCYSGVWNRERIERINRDFKSPWAWNQSLWERYILYLGGKSCLNNLDPRVAGQLSAALERRELKPFQSWFDVFELRDQLGIGYSPLKNRYGCPVTMLGILLEREGKLPAKGHSHRFHRQFQWFTEPVRSAIREYSEGFQKRKASCKALQYLLDIQQFHAWFMGDFFKATNVDAENFLRKVFLEQNTLAFVRQHNSLKRFYHWCLCKGLVSQNPFDLNLRQEFRKICTSCSKMKIVAHTDNRCKLCHVDAKIMRLIEATKKKLKSATPYNQRLFELHFQYISRYRITTGASADCKNLARFLEQKPIEPLLLWKDVRTASDQFNKFIGEDKRIWRGRPFVKIGYRLAELGVIPFLDQDEQTCLDHNLKKFPPDIEPLVRRYTDLQIKRRRRITTAIHIVHAIRYFLRWLDRDHPGAHLLSASEKMALQYLEKFPTAVGREHHRGAVCGFYKWAKIHGIVSQNPFESTAPLVLIKELPICSKEQAKHLFSFIKDPNSEPQAALMLSLILFFAFSLKELMYSTFELKEDAVEIGVFQPALSYGHRQPTRKNKLLLPKSPLWFVNLQKKYLEVRHHRFSKLKNPERLKTLFLAPNGRHNRPMSTEMVKSMIADATLKATGRSIPIRILRMTSGHIHTYHSDASMLAELGWTRKHAFTYTWTPRKYWS